MLYLCGDETMKVRCNRCKSVFDDEFRLTTCPHEAFHANDGNNNFTVHHDAHLSPPRAGDNIIKVYDADYYMRGAETGKSLYTNYRWLPHLTIPMCQAVANYLGIKKNHTVLDFGCARGYMVKALRHLGYEAYGIDASDWAVANSDDEVKNLIRCQSLISHEFDWIIAKDVLEHIEDIKYTIENIQNRARIGIFVVVPLSSVDGDRYVLEDYEKDVTHVHRLTLATWVRYFLNRGWDVKATYRVPGIKDNHYCPAWEPGDGFIVATRC